jgi:hypothetical protein
LVTLPTGESDLISNSLPAIQVLIDYPYFELYRVKDLTESARLAGFYRSELTKAGWTDQTAQLGVLAQQGELNLAGMSFSFYVKGELVALIGVSTPLDDATLTNLNLKPLLKPGELAVITLTGRNKLKI